MVLAVAVASAAESASMLLVNPHLLSVGMPACVGRTEADRDRDRETERQACNGNGARREGESERERVCGKTATTWSPG